MHIFEPVRAETFRTQVENRLREAITSGRLQAGQKLVERELCESMGISRPLLREALRRLEAEKLVLLIPHRGPEVARMTEREAREVYAVRRVLESYTAEEFTRRATEDEITRLSQCVARLLAAGKKKSREGVLQAKAEFYQILLTGAGNGLVQDMLGGLLSRVSLLRGTSLMSPDRLPRSLEEIAALLECIRSRDADGARRIAEKHVLNAEHAALAVMAGASGSSAPIPPILTKGKTRR
jgi:DNA-binding GntR family transcriptional regulator